MAGSRLCHVEDRAVTAEADDHIGTLQLPVQPVEADVLGQVEAFIHLKGQACPAFHAGILEHLHSLPQGAEVVIPVRVGSEDYFFHAFTPKVSWA